MTLWLGTTAWQYRENEHSHLRCFFSIFQQNQHQFVRHWNCNTVCLTYASPRTRADLLRNGVDGLTVPRSAAQSRTSLLVLVCFFLTPSFRENLFLCFNQPDHCTNQPRAQVHLKLTPAEVCVLQISSLTLHSPLPFVPPPRNITHELIDVE